MTGAEIYVLYAAVAISAAGAVYQGVQAQGQADIMEAQYREQAELAKISALQEEADRRERLRILLATQAAVGASSGVQLDASRSFLAAKSAEIEKADRDVRNIRLFGASQQRSLFTSAKAARAEGKAAMVGGLFEGASILTQGYYNAATLKAPKSEAAHIKWQ